MPSEILSTMTGSVPPATEDSSSSLGLPEFQAVLMAAGRGSRFNEITRHKAKCLLPIGNLPMVWYPLNMLQRAGFQGERLKRRKIRMT